MKFKPTLPIIYALKHGSVEQVQQLKQVIEQGDRDQLQQVIEIIRTTKALEYTQQIALTEVDLAKHHLESLPDSDYKLALLSLADFSVSRLF